MSRKVFSNPYIAYEYAVHGLMALPASICQSIADEQIRIKDKTYTMRLLSVGEAPKDAPTLVLIGGVHGLESIGVDILLNYIKALIQQSAWSDTTRTMLKNVRLLALPMANPSGIAQNSRANGHGVDLMRNAPIDARQRASWLVGGHRYSRLLPWYRGRLGCLEPESQVLFDWCNQLMCEGPITVIVDIHSGFGVHDQIWYPYAGQTTPFPNLPDVNALQALFDQSYPHHHHYVFSQQSEHYITHGDLWDWIFDHRQTQDPKPFIPLTLELGSWLWLKKNPRQLTHRNGLFHPVVAHRRSRVLRQHFVLFDFLLKACESWRHWTSPPS